MEANKHVFNILVTKGNKNLLADTNKLENLTDGQLALFKEGDDTGATVAQLTSANQKIALVLGTDLDGDGVVDEFRQHSGPDYFKIASLQSAKKQDYKAPKALKFEISNLKGSCSNDLILKLNFTSIATYQRRGYKQLVKGYNITTGCEDCNNCEEGCCNKIAKLIAHNINSDEDGLATAKVITKVAIDATTYGTSQDYAIGDEVLDADLDVLNEYNKEHQDAKVCTVVEVTGNPEKLQAFCLVNPMFKKFQGVQIKPILTSGFNCDAKVVVTQELEYEQGNSNQIQELEFEAGGWTGNPGVYRVSSMTGLPVGKYHFLTEKGEKYVVYSLTYGERPVSGWLTYDVYYTTIVAVPKDDSNTISDLDALLNKVKDLSGLV